MSEKIKKFNEVKNSAAHSMTATGTQRPFTCGGNNRI
jgi:hypothetical protein